MGPPIDLDPHREQILQLYRDDNSLPMIIQRLSTRYDINVSERTLHSRLQEWGVRKRKAPISDSRLKELENHI